MATESQGTYLDISTGATGGAETITDASASNPTVLTSSGHSLVAGDVVTMSAFDGADAADINGNDYVVKYVTTNTFAIELDGTGKTFYSAAGTATPQTWATVGEIVDINREDPGANEIDTTHLTSTAKEYLLGLEDSGTVTFTCNWLFSDTGQTALRTAKTNRTELSCRITYPDASTMTFDAYVTTFSGPGASVDDKLIGDVTMKITGAITTA